MLRSTRCLKNLPPPSTRKRFYKKVAIEPTKCDVSKKTVYQIKLDQRNLRTVGGGKVFQLPSEILANGVALEWAQQDPVINRACMPLTNLTGMCQDYDTRSKTKESIIAHLIKYLKTDTILFRAFDSDALREMEEENWEEPRQRLCELLDLQDEIGITDSFAPPVVTDKAIARVEEYLQTFDMWSLIAMEQLTGALKSTILPLLLSMREITAKEAVDISLVELDFQTNRWGTIEWHHGVEREDLNAKVSAATMVVHHSQTVGDTYRLTPVERLQQLANEL